MRPVKQRFLDDCFKACVASVLNLNYEDVPHFMEKQPMGTVMAAAVRKNMDDWFASRGMLYVEFGYDRHPQGVMHSIGETYPNLTYIMAGMSEGQRPHTVVCRGDQMIHDPAARLGNRGGLSAPGSDGLTHIGLITVLKPDVETVSTIAFGVDEANSLYTAFCNAPNYEPGGEAIHKRLEAFLDPHNTELEGQG